MRVGPKPILSGCRNKRGEHHRTWPRSNNKEGIKMATVLQSNARFFSDEEVAAVRRPLSQASFLPPRIYSSAEIFTFEKTVMFRKTWLPLCHASQISEPGSYIARQLFDEPVIALRDRDGNIRVFSNVCRHRNALLTRPGAGVCKGRRLTCPYHGWVYGLDGKLIAAPFMDQTDTFAKGDIGLPEVRFEIWHGFVMVNFDGEAPSLLKQLEPFEPKVAPYRFEDMVAIEFRRTTVAWNWKISLENFSEAYHQPFIHPDTFDGHFPATLATYEDVEGPYGMFWMHQKNNELPPFLVPPVEGMPEQYYRAYSVVNVYPLLHIFTDASIPLWMDWNITEKDSHELIWYMMVPKSRLADADEEALKMEFRAIMEPILLEDVEVCEAVGAGVRSELAQAGRPSHMEKTVHQFHNWLLDQYLEA